MATMTGFQWSSKRKMLTSAVGDLVMERFFDLGLLREVGQIRVMLPIFS